MNIGKRIQQIRAQNDMTQEQLANDLEISRQAVSRWEGGKAIPDIENLMYISDLYNISLDELIKGDQKVSQKIILDSKAKKWHILNIIFFITLLLYIVWFGYQNQVWQIGLGIAAVVMLVIDIRILSRARILKIKKVFSKNT